MATAPAARAAAHTGALHGRADRVIGRGRVRALPTVPALVIGLAWLLLLWSRFLPLAHSLWSDEAFSALYYIRPGPSGIWGNYIPNDHMLFELLTWASTNLTGDFSEPVMRFWSVAPGIAAVLVLTSWLWRRLGPWVAAVFAVLAAAAPLHLTLTSEARGYGLAYLAAAVMLIGADSFMWGARRRDLLLFVGAATAGIWTLPVFVLAFIPLAALLVSRPRLRRQAIYASLVVGALSFAFYLPVIGDVITSSGQQFGTQLPWYGVVTGPLDDLISPSVFLLFPHASLGATEIVGGCLIVAGVVVLWRVPERYLAAALVGPALFSYAFLEIGRFYEANRFVSFLELPLLACCAVALAACARLVRKLPLGGVLRAGLALAFSLFVLGKAEASFRQVTRVPIENFKQVAALVRASGISQVVTNSRKPIGFFYYLGTKRVQLWTPFNLERLFCSNVAPFVYLEHGRSALPNTSCLEHRGAIAENVPQTRSYIRVWFVTTTAPGQSPVATNLARIRGVTHPPPVTTCPTITELAPRSGPAQPVIPAGQAFTADLSRTVARRGATASLTVLGWHLVSSFPGAFAAEGTTFKAPGQFLVVRYRVTNLGPLLIKPEETVNTLFELVPKTGAAVMTAGTFDNGCAIAAASYAVDGRQPSPFTHVTSGATIETVAVYPLPAGLPLRALRAGGLRWAAPTLGLTAALPKHPS